MVANVPLAAARSTAMERRLRLRRQEARLRLKLLADAALLEAHHASQAPRMASMPPCGPPAQPPLRVQLAALQARLDASEQRVDELSRSLQVLVLAGDAKQMAAMGGAIGSVPSSVQADAAQQLSATATEVAQPVEAVVESVGSQLVEDSRMEAEELEEAFLVLSQASVVSAVVEGGVPGQASVEAAEVEEAHQGLNGARLGPLAPLSVATGGSTSILGAFFAKLNAAKSDALSPLSVAAGGSTTVVSSGGSATVVCSGVGSDTVVPVRVACVNCAGTGSLPQQFGLPVDPACLRCWGSGEVWSHEYGAGWPSL